MAERRASPRADGPFPAVVLDLNGRGRTLGVRATLENVGAGSFYLRTRRSSGPGEKLMVMTKLSHAIVLLRGSVTRAEELGGGEYGVAVAVERHQMFSLKVTQTRTNRAEFLSPEA